MRGGINELIGTPHFIRGVNGMEVVFNVAIGIFILGYLYLAFLLDKQSITGDIFGAGGFPIAIGILGLVCLVIITVMVAKKKDKIHIPMLDLKSGEGKRLVLNIAFLTVYLFLMDVIGFIASTLLFLFGSARAMGYKKIAVLILYTVVLTGILVVSFGKVFAVPLPRGVDIFRELSYIFY
jgi:putative tricarboxylic transport membrane protein